MPEVIIYPGDLADLKPLFHLSTTVSDDAWLDRLIRIERARRSRHFVVMDEGRPVGMAGLFYDPTGAYLDLEPPQIIDLAVLPSHQGRGIARALVEAVLKELHGCSRSHVWLAMNGHKPELHVTYRRLGFQLSSSQADWFGPGSCRSWYRRAIPI